MGRQMKSSSTILGYKFLTQAGDLKSSPIWRVNQGIGNTAEGIACCLFKMASSDLDPSLLRYLLGGGTKIWFGGECVAQGLTSLTIFKGHFGRKRYPFLEIFLKVYTYFSQLSHGKPPNFLPQSQKLTHVYGCFCRK